MGQRYFTKEVLAQAQAIAFEPRLWSRPQMPGVTIDGVESRDLDDAIWLQETEHGVILSIHVADVAEFVAPASALEKAAIARVQTRYLKRGNDPMLPHILSENHLSLHEGEARPTLTVSITLDQEASIQSIDVFESWITSAKQFSYPEVDQDLKNQHSPFYDFLNTCLLWADRLYQQRTDPEQLATQPEGSWMDENGLWISNEGTRYHAYLIIQEFMIVANRAIAQWLSERNLTALYRNHIPNIETNPHLVFQHLVNSGWDSDLHRQLQCGLNRAEYDLAPIGHFALKQLAYCHFTSPIRRLPDLINHRIVKAWLQGESPPYTEATLFEIRDHIESAMQTQAEATKEFFKSLHHEQYEALLRHPQSIETLDAHEFSLLLRYAATSEQIEQMETIVCDRLFSDQLSVEDWFVILFLSQHQTLQEKVLTQLQSAIHHGPSIIAIAQNQIEDWGTIDYFVRGNTSPFTAWLEVEISGALWTIETGTSHPRKQGAKHQACVAWIEAYCHHRLIPSTQGSIPSPVSPEDVPTQDAVLPSLDLTANPISQLNELCQKCQWERPTYLFYTEEAEGFMGECELRTGSLTILGFGSGARKAIAKQYAAQHVLDQIYSEPIAKVVCSTEVNPS